MSMNIQVAQRGRITLPKALRETYQIKPGDIFSMIDLGDGKFLLSRGGSQIDELCEQLREGLGADGETMESMLAALRIKREGS